ncbi:MAG: RagB/SusD family nutrient uptake outer membrane protein [Saprospiraceae bacterium]|nr:RagB/SusD family nutrient uptake outer membrane protein [Saprospiraceae bacterium]
MKKIFNSKFLAIAALSLAVGACTDLDNKETDSIIPKSTGGTSAGDPTELLNGAYKDLGAFTDQANIYALGMHACAEMIPPTRGVDWGDNGVWRTLDQHTWDATHSWNLNAWNQLNQRVYKCNQVLAANPSALQAAEAKFLRAFNMFHVMDYWGQVPFRNTTDGVDVNPKVMTRSEAFDFIVKDLEEALPALPKKGPSATNGAASKAAANFLLAKLYLNKAVYKSAKPEGPYTFDAADMNKVVSYVDAITADGYDLEANYFDNFSTAATKEIIFVSLEGSPSNRWFMTLHYDQNPSGWNGFATLADFYSKFSAADQRIGSPAKKDGKEYSGIGLGFLRGQQYKDNGTALVDSRSKKPLVFSDDVPLAGAATEKGIRVIKYHPANAGKYILARYGDAVAMKAEAQLRGGTGGAAGALVTINALRVKRGAAVLAALDLNAMADERGREVYWEGGRRSDEIRFGTFLTGAGVVNKNPGTVLYPIPADAVTSNPNLKQNAGY